MDSDVVGTPRAKKYSWVLGAVELQVPRVLPAPLVVAGLYLWRVLGVAAVERLKAGGGEQPRRHCLGRLGWGGAGTVRRNARCAPACALTLAAASPATSTGWQRLLLMEPDMRLAQALTHEAVGSFSRSRSHRRCE